MGVFNRIREFRDRKAYEKYVLFRERNMPYGTMYAQVHAYQKSTKQFPVGTNSERIEVVNEMKETVREAFMCHPAATEEDFERCWPAIRDEIFKQHTMEVLEIMLLKDS